MEESKVTSKKMDLIRAGVFLGITFLLTYSFECLVVWPLTKSTDPKITSMLTIIISINMLFPAISVLLTRIITKEGFKNMWILPKKFKKTFRYYLYAWFGFVVIILLGGVVYYLVFPQDFDLNLTYMLGVYEQSGVTMTKQQLIQTTVIQGLVGLFLAPVLNGIPCIGEELGWRGYLLPKTMGKLPVIPMLIVNGIIWGVWHAPITAIGHNYGLNYKFFPYAGILAMCVFCIATGSILSYLTWKAKSCLPAIIGHASLNGMGAITSVFLLKESSPFIGPAITGFVGGSVLLVVAIICAVLLQKTVKKEAEATQETQDTQETVE